MEIDKCIFATVDSLELTYSELMSKRYFRNTKTSELKLSKFDVYLIRVDLRSTNTKKVD